MKMADDLEEIDDVLVKPEKMKLVEFIKRYSKRLPLIVITDRDYDSNLRTIAANERLLVSHLLSQKRLILKSKKYGSVSIPEHFPITLERVNIFGRVVKREKVWDYINLPKIEKSQKIRFVEPFDHLLVSYAAPLNSSNLGLMTFQNVVIKHYLVVHPLKNDNINFDPTAILMEAEFKVQVVEGHKDMTDSAWSELLETCRLGLDQKSDVEPPELEKVFVFPTNNTNPTKRSKQTHNFSYYNARTQHEPQKQQYSKPQQPSYRNQVDSYDFETSPEMTMMNEGMRGVKLTNSEEKRVTISTTHNNGRSAVSKQQNTRSSRDHVNFKESWNNTNNHYNGYNNNINNSSRIIPSRPSYRAGQSNIGILAGQHPQRLNIDQKGPGLQNKSSFKYGNTRQDLKMDSFGEFQAQSQRLAVMGKTNSPQNQQIIKMNNVDRGNRRSKSYDLNNNSVERTASESLFMQITESDADSDETFRGSKLNKTFDNSGLPPERLLQVPNVQYGRIDNNVNTRLDKNSKSLSDLRFERLSAEKSIMKEESDDADVENESQITVICGKPYLNDRQKVQVSRNQNISMRDLTDRNNSSKRSSEAIKLSTINSGSHKLVPRTFTNVNKQQLHAMPSRESYASRVSGQESDTSNIYLRYRRPVAKKYLKRFKYSSDVDFSGSEDLPRNKGIPYGYMEPDYNTRMKMRMNRSYLNSTSDLDTVLRSKTSFGQHDYNSDAYLQGFQNVRGNRLSMSSMILDPVLDETSHMYRRNINQGPLDGRHRNRSSPGKVVLMNRQGQIITREISPNYFSSLQSQQSTPASRTLISLTNGNSQSQSNLRRPIRENSQGMYKQVINIR